MSFGIEQIAWYVGQALLIGLALGTALHALMNKRDPRAAIGWVALCLFAPLIGPLGYLLLGINRTTRAARQRHEDVADVPVTRFAVFGDNPIGTPPAPTDGNAVAAFLDGAAAFDAMLAAIDGATEQVWLSQYIFESRGIGERFIAALAAAVQRGVQVCAILDRVGALYSIGSTRRRLESAGVHVAVFLPVRNPLRVWRLNLRNHRKILVVDCQCAFVGGMNIRNGYLPRERDQRVRIRDAHFELRGPIVADIAAVFEDDWHYASGHALDYPVLTPGRAGAARCRLTIDGPDNSADLLTMTLLSAIGAASERIRIVMPYFLPPRELLSALQVAALRGIRVDIVLPERNNLAYVHWAMQHALPELLRYDIRVHYQAGSFDHSKLIVIDDRLAIIGSVNIDARSLRLNFELAVEVWELDFVAALNAHIDRLIDGSAEVSLQSLSGQRWWRRLRNAVAWLGSPYL